MIQRFLITQFLNIKRVLIDPEMTNTRAVHVYKKIWHDSHHDQHENAAYPSGQFAHRTFCGYNLVVIELSNY